MKGKRGEKGKRVIEMEGEREQEMQSILREREV